MSGALSILGLNPYSAVIQPSSWRGIPFVVTNYSNAPSRNIAIHVYPYAMYPYVEDLGAGVEYIDVRGFLTSPLQQSPEQVYGKSERAFRQTLNTLYGPGIFVHPSLGSLTVVCVNASMSYSKDKLGSIALSLRFVIVDPASKSINAPKPNTQFSLQGAVSSAFSSFSQSFTSAAEGILTSGIGLAVGSALTAAAYIATAVSICTDASSAAGEVTGLGFVLDGTVTLGRYSSGALSQAPAALQAVDTTLPIPAIIQTGTQILRDARIAAISNVTTTTAALTTAAESLSAATLGLFCNSVVSAVQSLAAAANDPSDQIRLLTAMATVTTPNTLPGATATGNLLTWAALAELANTISTYQPTSSTDADDVLAVVTPIYQAAIIAAGDIPDIVAYTALGQLLSRVWSDLTARGAQLPPLVEWTVPANMPACTLAQRMYQDGSRRDDLILRVNPPHPLFFPATFQALSY